MANRAFYIFSNVYVMQNALSMWALIVLMVLWFALLGSSLFIIGFYNSTNWWQISESFVVLGMLCSRTDCLCSRTFILGHPWTLTIWNNYKSYVLQVVPGSDSQDFMTACPKQQFLNFCMSRWVRQPGFHNCLSKTAIPKFLHVQMGQTARISWLPVQNSNS